MNDDIVAALERERLNGMPRWNLTRPRPTPWFDDESVTDLATVTPLRPKSSKSQVKRAI